MKAVFITDYFTGQGNASCFDNFDKLMNDLNLFRDSHNVDCLVHQKGHWSGTIFEGMKSNCTCGVIDNQTYQGYVKPLLVPESCKGLWYSYETDMFTIDEQQNSEFMLFNSSCYQ